MKVFVLAIALFAAPKLFAAPAWCTGLDAQFKSSDLQYATDPDQIVSCQLQPGGSFPIAAGQYCAIIWEFLYTNEYLNLGPVTIDPLFLDVNGDGVVDATDYGLVHNRAATHLP